MPDLNAPSTPSSNDSPTSSTRSEDISPEQSARDAAARRIVFLTVFLDLLGFGILIPQLGLYGAQFGASPQTIGWLLSIYSVMQFLFAPFWGKLSDRVGRRPVLLWSVLGTAISYYIFAFSDSVEWLFISRVFAGITGANIGVAQAYISDVTPESERFKSFGMFGAMFGIGFAIGPLLGSLFATLPGAWGGNFGVGIITGSLSLFNYLLALKILPETLSPDTMRANRNARDGVAWWKVIEPQSFRRAFAIPCMKLTMTISFISIVAFSTLTGTFTLFIVRQYTRPEVQSLIKTDPQAAIAQAKTHLQGHDATSSTRSALALGGEGATVVPEDRNLPYSRAMGGDFNPPSVSGVAPPSGSSWREIEKALVQPLAAQKVGFIFAAIGVLALLIQGGMINPLKKRFGEINLIIVGVGLLAVGLALVPAPRNFLWQFPVAAVLAIGNSISAPVLTALVSLLSPEAERGEVLGVFQSTQSLGRILGPVIGNYLFDFVSVPAPYYVGAAIMLVAWFLTFRLRPSCGTFSSQASQTETASATL